MESDRKDEGGARRPFGAGNGLVLRATRRGALVLETENARRMMRKLAGLGDRPSPGPDDDVGTAPATSP